MKKTLVILGMVAVLAGSAFGQGQVTMANNSSSLITFEGSPVAIGSTSFQLTWGNSIVGPANSYGSLTPIGLVVGVNSAAAGRIASYTTPLNGLTAGATLAFQILAWQGGWADYATALANQAPTGFSTQFTSLTSADVVPPPTAVSLAGKYAGFELVAVPEPSTMALFGLGAVALLAFRRRK